MFRTIGSVVAEVIDRIEIERGREGALNDDGPHREEGGASPSIAGCSAANGIEKPGASAPAVDAADFGSARGKLRIVASIGRRGGAPNYGVPRSAPRRPVLVVIEGGVHRTAP